MKLVECVPNISEGQDPAKIQEILEALNLPEVYVLHVDSGAAANRTVITFVTTLENALEVGLSLTEKCITAIDLRTQSGVHPRTGALDVFPIVPLLDTSIDECNIVARELAKQTNEKFGIPTNLYAESARSEERTRLSYFRKNSHIDSDFGKTGSSPKSGSILFGARELMLAYNVSLSCKTTKVASSIAKQIREGGTNSIPGCRALGWYIDEYHCSQVTTNLYQLEKANLGTVFKAVQNLAERYGIEVLGSELIGMIPKSAIASAGELLSPDKTDLIEAAISGLGLDLHHPFNPAERLIGQKLARLSNGKISISL